ncbi:octanoyltransferase [Sphingobium sp. SYK-6]|uniref:lipoyl(octanoyl) transferase LipB n=1 Tax=Sphingobium sp. (strain NBRC 103272 / SYK-6) TaxID=627192 RepID=UPI00022779FF|nr:lipoyl(octanoyl) transferase LipB [Sphingobium sp. SYK-6]BAK68107.1 octanoyltransferase [Sphingobium sp. SYK-6]
MSLSSPLPASLASATGPAAAIDWRVEPGFLDYEAGLADMESRAAAIAQGAAPERIWLVEHPPLYTAGTSAQASDLLAPRFPVHVTGRGGQYTYHGPGQRVVYLNLDLARRGRDVRRFVQGLEQWMIAALGDLGVTAWTADGRVGVWTTGPDGTEAKIGAIGVRLRKWVTLHGLAINVAPDLAHYDGIVPCGIRAFGVTSLQDLGLAADMARLDAALAAHLPAMLSAIGTIPTDDSSHT